MIHFLSLHRLSPVVPQAHAAPTVATQCCHKVVTWPSEWFSLAHNGDLLALSKAIGEALHDPHCEWRSQGPRVLSNGGGSPHSILSVASTAVRVDVSGSPVSWALPSLCDPSLIEKNAALDWVMDDKFDDVSRRVFLAVGIIGLRRTATRSDVLWPLTTESGSNALPVWTTAVSPHLHPVGEYELDCFYCGCTTSPASVERVTSGASEGEGDETPSTVNTTIETIKIDALTAHHPWCLWKKNMLSCVVPAAYQTAPALTVAISATVSIVVVGGAMVVDALVGALRTSQKFSSELVMRHPCWQYTTAVDVMAELNRTKTSAPTSALPQMRSWTSRVPETDVGRCLVVCSRSGQQHNGVAKKDSNAKNTALENYLKLRSALLAPRVSREEEASRKRPRDEEDQREETNSEGASSKETTQSNTAVDEEESPSLEGSIRAWETQRHQKRSARESSPLLLPQVVKAPPSHTFMWELLQRSVECDKQQADPLSDDARARVEKLLLAVRQAVTNAQVTRAAAPAPPQPMKAAPQHPQQQAHHRPPPSMPPMSGSFIPSQGGVLPQAPAPFAPPQPFPLTVPHHHHHHQQHRTGPFRPAPPVLSGQGLFDTPHQAGGVLTAPPPLLPPLLAPPVFGQSAPQRSFPPNVQVTGRNSGEVPSVFGGSVLGMAPPSAPTHPFRGASDAPPFVPPPAAAAKQPPPLVAGKAVAQAQPFKQPAAQQNKQPPEAGRGKQLQSNNDAAQRPATQGSKQPQGKAPPPAPPPGKQQNNGNINNRQQPQQQDQMKRGGRGGGRGGGGGQRR
ncbi:Hypothetical protein, putative [Bodo saltans]|uniref:Zinc finger protein n=1 Tax=Bodo saltans TaxID=75058 RepID=A0A0S4JLY1_BODSA|nr:Hypothetical protein, putative [Bodo saltans]|eukprot:CUG91641.1 Hypothetical protein, putative [Bodo saltans]